MFTKSITTKYERNVVSASFRLKKRHEDVNDTATQEKISRKTKYV